MKKDRMKLVKKIVEEAIQDVRCDKNTLEPIAVIIDNQQSNGIQESLEEKKFIVFSPRKLSEAAVENMDTWPEYSRDTYQTSKLPSCFMIVDPTQEEKSQSLARTMIRFYNETAGNYNLLNKPNADGEMIPAFEGVGKLDDLLAKVGFMVQKSDDGNTITVSGEGFTLTVDGPNGEIVDTPQQGETGIGAIPTGVDTYNIPITEMAFESLYELGEKGIATARKWFSKLRGNSR